MAQSSLQKRVAALEKQLAELQFKNPSGGAEGQELKSNWREIAGVFAGDPDFKDAVELGAAFRRRQRPRSPGRAGRKG
jgi:hypothetical protein